MHQVVLRIPVSRLLLVLGLLTSASSLCPAQAPTEEPWMQPHWIWTHQQTGVETTRFTRRFQTVSPSRWARLTFAPVSASLTVWLDGKQIASAEPYDPIQTIDVPIRLSPGPHKFSVSGIGQHGPSCFFAELAMEFEDGVRTAVFTDERWRTQYGELAKDFGLIDPTLIVPDQRRVGIDVTDNYEQWKQASDAKEGTDPASFLIAPGFEITRVFSAKAKKHDSWVSMAFDSDGRVIIAKEQSGLLRMTLADDGESVTQVEKVNKSMKECRGLQFVGKELFANANNSKVLYRLRPKKNRFSEPEPVLTTTGGVGHGRNDLAVGHDYQLYSIHGDSVDLPTDVTDLTSPFRQARQGEKTNEGHLLRIDPDSGGVEIVAAGLRNPFGIDFNQHGDVFTYDADAEYDMGTPWYRPTRVSLLVPGGDYGWRGVTKSWPSYYHDHPDNASPSLDIGKGSPTAVKFGTRSNFPDKYKQALFILDWAYGRILAVHMIPRGAGYLMRGETFLKGRPLNVTDLDFAPDGSMYLVTGGRKTQSALYRIRYVGPQVEPPPMTEQQKLIRQYAKNSRQLRRDLEAMLTADPNPNRTVKVWKHLSSTDPWIHEAAIRVLERESVSSWSQRALTEPNVTVAARTLMSLARSGQSDLVDPVIRRLNQILPMAQTESDKTSVLYAYQLLMQKHELDQATKTRLASTLNSHYPSDRYAENRLLSELLSQLQAPDFVSKTIGLLRSADDQVQQMQYLYALRNVKEGWTADERREYFAALNQSRHYLGGQGMNDFLNRIREEAVATLNDTERDSLAELLDPEVVEEETAATDGPREMVQKWQLADLQNDLAGGDRQRGAKIFAAASCSKCHRFGSRGVPMGPDLTSVASRFSRRDLLVSMLEPSKVIAENYRSLQIVTSDGKTFTGQVCRGGDYRSPVLRLATDPLQPSKFTEIAKTEIESQKVADASWMPTGLLDTFTKAEIRDLLAYLEAGP